MLVIQIIIMYAGSLNARCASIFSTEKNCSFSKFPCVDLSSPANDAPAMLRLQQNVIFSATLFPFHCAMLACNVLTFT